MIEMAAAWEWLVQNTWLLLSIFASAFLASLTLYSGQFTSNLIGGVMLMTRGIYRKGDYVTIGEAHGKVQRVGWLYTHLTDEVGRNVFIIENSAVTGVIVNHSRIQGAPVYVDVPIYDYGNYDRAGVEWAILNAMRTWSHRFDVALQAWVQSHDGEAEIWRALIYVADEKLARAEMLAGELRKRICETLEAQGVTVRDDDRVDVYMGGADDEA
jgi:hypothetical protein